MAGWLKNVLNIAPMLIGTLPIPGAGLLAGAAAHGIQAAQAAHDASVAGGGTGLTGAERLAFAKTEILDVVNGINAVKPGKVDPAVVDDAFMKVVGTVVDVSKTIETAKTDHAMSLGKVDPPQQ